MMRPVRFLSLILALVVALTSGTMAVARGQVRSGDRIVICSGLGIVTVEVDAQGNPVGPVHICPDCALSFLAHLDTVAPSVLRPLTPGLGLLASPQRLASGRAVPMPRARGPPALV